MKNQVTTLTKFTMYSQLQVQLQLQLQLQFPIYLYIYYIYPGKSITSIHVNGQEWNEMKYIIRIHISVIVNIN